MTRDYAEFASLCGLYLADSYVLDIVERASAVKFVLEAVLMPEHSSYHEPSAGEQYCYVTGELVFSEVLGVEWLDRPVRKYKDASGAEDLGNIDSLTCSGGVYSVNVDWRNVRIRSNADPEFLISEE
ncbi:hypothetical protein AB0M22_35090 [Nocardia sp. NPDC051756]|uniref:hypothetical protein n=1 Tax=Nocardia sp. NPDC051756 TaxID=3154751 RepID=UPI00344264CC